jgi:IPT/TIG domain-containing protein
MSRRLLSLLATMSLVIIPMAFASGPSGGTGGSGGGGTGGTGGTCGCIGLAVSKETAPPGALSQMKISLTEPKPISTGTGSVDFTAYDSLVGISLASHTRDAWGVAVVNGGSLKLSIISPSATFGDTIDYPILTIVGRVPSTALIGTKYPLNIDPTAVQFYSGTGTLYPVEVKNGQLVAGNVVSIGNVVPGSAVVPAGGTVTITGVGFQPGINVKFAEATVASVQYVNSTQLIVTLGTQATMSGQMIKVSNPDGTSDVYYSYQRTYPMAPSADPVMQLVMPLLPPNEVNLASVAIPAPAASTTYGIALQNIEPTPAVATVNLLDASGNFVTSTQVTVAASGFVVRELSELFGAAPAAAATVQVTSPNPIQVLGVIANQTTGTASPIVAQ